MPLIDRNSHGARTSKTHVTLRIATVLAALLAAPAIVRALVPTSLAVLQVVLDACQFYVSVLRICSV